VNDALLILTLIKAVNQEIQCTSALFASNDRWFIPHKNKP